MYLIQNGRVHVGDGNVREHCDILVQGTKIRKMGKNLIETIGREEYTVIDATDREVFPGFIDPISSIGAMGIPGRYMDNDETSEPVFPELNLRYAMDPDEVDRQEFYRSGITAIGLSPAGNTVMGGQIAVVKTAPFEYRRRIVREHAGLKCSVSTGVKETFGGRKALPMTKMGIFHLFQETLRSARAEEESKRTDRQRLLLEIFDRHTMPVFCQAATKTEIDGLLHLWEGETAALHLVDGFSFADSMDGLLRNKVGLVLGNVNEMSQLEKHGMKLSELKTLHANGNRIAFTNTAGGYSEGREVFLWTAIEAYRAGVPAEDVVRMMCEHPAHMLRVQDRIGMLKEGMDADLSIFTDHPVKTYVARVECSIIDGEVILS